MDNNNINEKILAFKMLLVGIVLLVFGIRMMVGGAILPAVFFSGIGIADIGLVIKRSGLLKGFGANESKSQQSTIDNRKHYEDKKVDKICPNCGSRNVHTTSSEGREHEHECFYYCYDCGRVF